MSSTMHHPAPYVLLQLLVDESVVILATASESAIDALFLGDGRSMLHVIVDGAMKLFLEDRVLINGLELGLEVAKSLSAAVGATT